MMKWILLLLCLLSLAAQAAPITFGSTLSAAALTDPVTARDELLAAREAGMRHIRIRADWPRLQSTAQGWDFAWLDALIAEAVRYDLEPILVFGRAPAWSITYLRNPGEAERQRARPDNAAYGRYVTTVATRYRHRVRTYQLWDRPGPDCLVVNAADIYALYRTGTRAVHAVDPALRVIAPEPGDVNLGWLYGYYVTVEEADAPDILLLAPLRHALAPDLLWRRVTTLRAHLLPRRRMPALWAETSSGGRPDTDLATVTAAALLAECTGVLTTPADPGVRRLASLQGTQYAGWTQATPDTPAGVFLRNDGQTTLLLLPARPNTLTLAPVATPLPNALPVQAEFVEITHLDGTPQRVLVVTTIELPLAGRPVLLAGARVTPWPGIPSRPPDPIPGDTVTLDPLGRDPRAIRPLPDFPAGRYRLLQYEGRTVLSTVREVAPWIHFDIPDGFLFFNTPCIPVDVTVHVLGVTRQGESGFNLYYDAVGGMRHTPWQWVDTGPDTVHAYTFRLTDALFANQHGYDLRLNMGGSKENIRMVELSVTRHPVR